MTDNPAYLGKFLIDTAPKIGDLELPSRVHDRVCLFDDDQWPRGEGSRDEKRDPMNNTRYRDGRRNKE